MIWSSGKVSGLGQLGHPPPSVSGQIRSVSNSLKKSYQRRSINEVWVSGSTQDCKSVIKSAEYYSCRHTPPLCQITWIFIQACSNLVLIIYLKETVKVGILSQQERDVCFYQKFTKALQKKEGVKPVGKNSQLLPFLFHSEFCPPHGSKSDEHQGLLSNPNPVLLNWVSLPTRWWLQWSFDQNGIQRAAGTSLVLRGFFIWLWIKLNSLNAALIKDGRYLSLQLWPFHCKNDWKCQMQIKFVWNIAIARENGLCRLMLKPQIYRDAVK